MSGADMRIKQNYRGRFERYVGINAGFAEQALDDPAVLHVGRQQAQWDLCHLSPADVAAIAERRIGSDEEAVSLAGERHRCDATKRFVVEISKSGIDFEVFEMGKDFDGRL